jgi:hypothetical protein
MAPTLAAPGRRMRDRLAQLADHRLGRGIGDDDPVELAEERQARGGLAFEQEQDDREAGRLHASVEGLVVFEELPGSETALSDDEDERVGPGYGLGECGQPEAADAQRLRGEEDLDVGQALEAGRERVDERQILRVVGQEPAMHAALPVRCPTQPACDSRRQGSSPRSLRRIPLQLGRRCRDNAAKKLIRFAMDDSYR